MKRLLPLALLLPLLTACPPSPIPCPPNCAPPATATPTNPPTRPTATPIATIAIATPTIAIATPVPPVQVQQLTRGRAVVEVDLRGFVAAPPLDYYAIFTGMYDSADKHAPALELSLRGLSSEPCLRTPCGASALGLVVRESGDILHDGKEPDEHLHCGEGVNYSRRLPIGSEPVFLVIVEWDASGWTVMAPGGTVHLSKGSPRVGLGAASFPLPSDRGIGWARHPWTGQANGAKARLVSWEALPGEQPPLGSCP